MELFSIRIQRTFQLVSTNKTAVTYSIRRFIGQLKESVNKSTM